ncbi:MAG TPA: hypothetical protein EYG92_03865, partial [Lutibacter sp.]|nr:hypothetical protein [Lutibacter sp.]
MKKYLFILIVLLHLISFSQEKEETYGLLTKITPVEENKDQIFLKTLLKNLKPGDTLNLKPGFYTGPATIEVPNVVIDGGGKATISGMGNESVLFIKADNVTIKNLHITNSGDSPDRLDAGVKIVEANNTLIQNCKIDECLFG